mgnify:CR=1 FL=1
MTSAEMLRSTFAFNSDLGESFMVLDPRGQTHTTSSSIYQVGNKGTNAAALNSSHRDSQRRPPVQTSTAAGLSARAAGARQDARPGVATKDTRLNSRHLENTRIEIENELNNPLVQSYLSTHAPSPLARSHFDFDNLTQSTISTFNKDTIDNTEGVLNLLQTVRRIGESPFMFQLFSNLSFLGRNFLPQQVMRTLSCCLRLSF